MTTPFHEFSNGLSTAASFGPAYLPCRGLSTVFPLTSWSYVRTTRSLLATFGEDRTCNSVLFMSSGSGNVGSVVLVGAYSAVLVVFGGSNKNEISISATFSLLYFRVRVLSEVSFPIATDSTSS